MLVVGGVNILKQIQYDIVLYTILPGLPVATMDGGIIFLLDDPEPQTEKLTTIT